MKCHPYLERLGESIIRLGNKPSSNFWICPLSHCTKLAIVSAVSGDFLNVSVAPISGEKWYVKGHESFVTKQVSDLRLLSRLRLLCMENVNVVNPGPILLEDGILSVSLCAHTSFESCMKYRHSIVPSCHVLKESMSSTRALVFGGKNKQHPSRFKALWKYLF